MSSSAFDPSPEPAFLNSQFLIDPDNDDDDRASDPRFSDGDTASARSISLSSPPRSPRESSALDLPNTEVPAITPVTLVRQSLSLAGVNKRHTAGTASSFTSEGDGDGDDRSFFVRKYEEGESPLSSVAPSVHEIEKPLSSSLPSPLPPASSEARPPLSVRMKSDAESIASFNSSSTSHSKKARPESLLIQAIKMPLVLGIALVDFNHLVGPKIEFSRGDIFDDEEIAKILPFLALPDGAHLTIEDYSYFHLVPSVPNPSTIFGISCNRQISTAQLLVKDVDVTRSTVQKAVVVLSSKPVFGPVRDRLGVVTRTLFSQCDFTDTSILDQFYSTLELSLRGQLTESGLYMGTSLRELVHNFRQRTLVLVKALMLQKKIMFFGHPVERLCTYQYSLVTLIPGLLQHLDDCGSPPLAYRAQTLSRPNSLKTSDSKSMMAYMGLPLDLFGKDAFFQPYLPLQQLDMLRDTECWLCGSTNSIVTEQKEIDLLVNIETGAIEFRNPAVERMVALTSADRKWMDDIVKDVNDGYSEDPDISINTGMYFKGSDDYLRQKFEEYIMAALSSVKYTAFLARGKGNGVIISEGSGDSKATDDFNPVWIQEFKRSHAYEIWERITDPLLFDIIEARHPCGDKPSVVADIGLRLSEGIQELKLEQQLAPTREAISRTFATGSTNLLNAVVGVRERWMQRNPSLSSSVSIKSDSSLDGSDSTPSRKASADVLVRKPQTPTSASTRGLRTLSIQPEPPKPAPLTFGSWGANIGSFFAQRTSRLSLSSERPLSVASSPRGVSPVPSVQRLSVQNDKAVPPLPKEVPAVPKEVPPVPKEAPHPPSTSADALNEKKKEEHQGLQPSVNQAHAPNEAESLQEYETMSTHSSVAGMAM